MKVLVLGYGSMGRRHVKNAVALGHDLRVYDPAHRPSMGEMEFLGREEAGWEWGPDAVVVASPAREHARAFWQARRLKVPALVEKPLALSVDDLHATLPRDRVPQHARAWAVEAVGYNLRFDPVLGHGASVHLPDVGRPLAARLEVSCDMATWPGVYDDALLECSHEVDLALWLLGPARLAGAAGGGATWELLLEHESGCATSVRVDGRRPGYRRGGAVEGEKGTWRWQWTLGGRSRSEVVPHGGRGRAGYSATWDVERTYRDELAAFLESARTGELAPGMASVADGEAVLRVLDGARALSSKGASQNPQKPQQKRPSGEAPEHTKTLNVSADSPEVTAGKGVTRPTSTPKIPRK